MSMTDDDREGLASEYALGTLDADERAQAEALMLVDPGFAESVRRWERRLGELNVMVAAVEPPASVWEAIKEKLPATPQSAQVRLPEIAPPVTPQAPAAAASAQQGAEIVDLTARLRRWRGITAIVGTLAAGFAAIVVAREIRPDLLPAQMRPKPRIEVVERIVEKPAAQPAQFVAVFQKDEQSPAFVLSVDIDKRMVTVRQVAAEKLPDKTYQLWIATQPGTPPRSLGLITDADYTVREALADYDPAVISNATYGISLEPPGGSPTGAPTGPVIHAKLLQVTPAPKP
jgi:anti-sigma-K factor RskA